MTWFGDRNIFTILICQSRVTEPTGELIEIVQYKEPMHRGLSICLQCHAYTKYILSTQSHHVPLTQIITTVILQMWQKAQPAGYTQKKNELGKIAVN